MRWTALVTVVLNRGHASPGGGVNPHPGGASSCALYNMASFWMGKCSRSIYSGKVRGAWNTGQLLQGGVLEKMLRTTGLSQQISQIVWLLEREINGQIRRERALPKNCPSPSRKVNYRSPLAAVACFEIAAFIPNK